ncbi:FUSC family protein [Orrella sp. JC864]|uniref:FUSC family protein n=1 Tax=Orrella sp. JC864 TaxID=3120298 RepID=UPI0012BD3B1D
MGRALALGRLVWKDELRLALQTVAAVLLAYHVARWQALPDLSWAAFSALFVVRASAEGTVGEAGARMLGALAGVCIGVTFALLANGLLDQTVSILAGVGLMSYLVARKPILSYGLVTAVILTVTPDPDVITGAWDKVVAIGTGSLCGACAGLTVLPISARRRARNKIAESLEMLGELARTCTATFIDCRASPRQEGYSTVDPSSETAREMLAQARAGLLHRRSARPAGQVLARVDGLWRTVPLLDRATQLPLSETACQAVGHAFEALAQAFAQDMRSLAAALRQRRAPHASLRTGPAMQELEDALARHALPDTDREAARITRWAWRQLIHEQRALERMLRQAHES